MSAPVSPARSSRLNATHPDGRGIKRSSPWARAHTLVAMRAEKRRRLSTPPAFSAAAAAAAAAIVTVKETGEKGDMPSHYVLAALDQLVDDLLRVVVRSCTRADRVVLGFMCPRAATLIASEAAAAAAPVTLDPPPPPPTAFETQVLYTYADGSIRQIDALHARVNASVRFPAAQWLGLLSGPNSENAGLGDELLGKRLLPRIGVDKSAFGPEFVAGLIRDATVKGMQWFMRDLSHRAWAGDWLHDPCASQELVKRGHDAPFVNVVLAACNITCIVAYRLLFDAIAQRKWALAQAILRRNPPARGHYHCLVQSSPHIRSRIVRSLIELDCDEAMEFMLSPDGCAVHLDSALLLHTTDAPRAAAYLKRRLAAAAVQEQPT